MALLFFVFLLGKQVQNERAFVVNSQGLNVRNAPSIKGKVIHELKKGDTIFQSAVDGNWVAFKFNEGQVGYVSKSYLSEVKIVPIAKVNEIDLYDSISFSWIFRVSAKYMLYLLLPVILIALLKHYLF